MIKCKRRLQTKRPFVDGWRDYDGEPFFGHRLDEMVYLDRWRPRHVQLYYLSNYREVVEYFDSDYPENILAIQYLPIYKSNIL